MGRIARKPERSRACPCAKMTGGGETG
jgi:hypothetical protein